jgi:hypothetical protein
VPTPEKMCGGVHALAYAKALEDLKEIADRLLQRA